MANRLVRIKPATLLEKDASNSFKQYSYDGETFTCSNNQEVSIPDYVATAWVTHDSDMEVITNPTS